MNLLYKLFFHFGIRYGYPFIPDKTYLKMMYYCQFKKKLNLKNPTSFNEKIQWLKLYGNNEQYTNLADKEEVKQYVANLIDSKYVIPTLHVYKSERDIDFQLLPDKCVLKCTHDSGGVFIYEKNKTDIRNMQKQLKRHLHRNYFWSGREKQYKNIIPRIIVEPFIEDSVFHELRDYKFFVFDGKVKFMYIASNRQSNKETCFDFFDCNFRHLPFTNGHPNSSVLISKPIHFDLMIELAEVLAQKIPFVRIDFYEANNQVYFGEYTFSHFSGFIPFNPETWDNKIGQYLSLTKCYE